MKKMFIAIMAICSFCGYAKAQDAVSNKSVKLSFGQIGNCLEHGDFVLDDQSPADVGGYTEVLYLEATPWTIGNWSVGGYLGGSTGYYGWKPDDPYPGVSIERTWAFRYGVTASAHVLPLAGVNSKMWDVELKGSAGSYFQKCMTLQSEYSIGVSVGFYPLKHWGIFAESQWGKFVYSMPNYYVVMHGNTMVRGGISYRF